MDISIEILSRDRSLLGFCYNRGKALEKKTMEETTFYEFGIGLLFIQIHLTFY